MNNEKDFISLKWGTLKAWDIKTPSVLKLLEEHNSLGSALGAMQQNDTPLQKELICAMIDACNAEKIYLAWDGEYVSKEQAKKYVMNYGKKR